MTKTTAAEVALPDIGADPGVATARRKRDELRADLGGVRAELASLGEAGTGPAPDPIEVEARKLAGDPSASADTERIVKAARGAELRHKVKVLELAVKLASDACDTAERQAAAALTPTAIATAFAPKVRAAALAYIAAVVAVDATQAEYRRLRSAGFTSGLSSPFQRSLPLTTEFGNGLPDVLKSLITAGVVTREEVVESLPVLATRGHI